MMIDDNRKAIDVQGLVVEYHNGKRAVDSISFQVSYGECVGFIGVNGAGKSSTIKTMLGFHFPTQGSVRVLGLDPGNAESRKRVGYLPEVAVYYPFLKAREILELYGGLQGLDKTELRKRISPLLEELGLGGCEETLVREFSKGMQQRLGIAQAIIAQPELMIFDELTSGLDPLGRHELHQVLLRHKSQGKTLFFSSHDLGDVEHLCDRIIMIHQGKIIHQATIAELLQPLSEFVIVFELPPNTSLPGSVINKNPTMDSLVPGRFTVKTRKAEDFAQTIQCLSGINARLIETGNRTTSLEDEFIHLVHLNEKHKQEEAEQ